ncbi:MAG: hypothetical protein ABII00_03045 [Elusimicrobiota bacterium]
MRKPLARTLIGLGGICLGLDVFESVSSHAHGHAGSWWHTLPGFELAYGLAGCVLLAAFAKRLLHPLLARAKDHYEGRQ